MKQLEVSILGQVYVLGCPEGGETLLGSAVSAVDREMTGIRDAGKVKARERIAVLAALNLAYQLAERTPSGARAATAAPTPGGATGGAVNGLVNGLAYGSADAFKHATPQSDEAALDALIRRLDHALGDDGQLL